VLFVLLAAPTISRVTTASEPAPADIDALSDSLLRFDSDHDPWTELARFTFRREWRRA